jgi:hypothetical protein
MFVLALVLLSGCKRDSDVPSSTARIASTQPTTTTVPTSAILTIDNATVRFPPLHLLAESTGGGVSVRLTTPAAHPSTANVINFDLTLEDVDDPADISGAAWHFRTDDPERRDTLNAITLRGRAVVLEPRDVHIHFGRQADRISVEIEGEFRWFEPADVDTPLKTVSVNGILWTPAPKSP